MERISQSQLIMLLTLQIYGPGARFLITLPALNRETGYTGWICLIAGWAGALAIMFPLLKVASSRPDEFISRFGGQLVGRWLHVLFVTIVLLHFMYNGAINIREISDFLELIYLPLTPSWAIASLYGLSVILAVRSGIETIFRAASGLLFSVVFVALLIPILLVKDFIWPIAGALIRHWELKPIWGGSLMTAGVLDMTMVLFIYPHLRNKDKTFRSLVIGSGCGVFLCLLTYLTCMMVFGVHMSFQFPYPSWEMYRAIRVGDFLENMDPLFFGIYFSSTFIHACIVLYIVVSGIGQLFGLKQSKPLAFSIGAVIIGMSDHIAQNSAEMQDFMKRAFPLLALLIYFILLLYLLGLWRHKRSPRKHDPAAE